MLQKKQFLKKSWHKEEKQTFTDTWTDLTGFSMHLKKASFSSSETGLCALWQNALAALSLLTSSAMTEQTCGGVLAASFLHRGVITLGTPHPFYRSPRGLVRAVVFRGTRPLSGSFSPLERRAFHVCKTARVPSIFRVSDMCFRHSDKAQRR